jgi:hypothetical protein
MAEPEIKADTGKTTRAASNLGNRQAAEPRSQPQSSICVVRVSASSRTVERESRASGSQGSADNASFGPLSPAHQTVLQPREANCRYRTRPIPSRRPLRWCGQADIAAMALVFPDRIVCARQLRFLFTPQSDSARRIQGRRAPAPASRPETTAGNRPHRLRLQDSRKSLYWHARAFEQPHTADFPRNALNSRTLIPIEHCLSIAVLVWRNKDQNYSRRDWRCSSTQL